MVVHRLFDPLIEAASALGAGLDWKTSLQELSAEHGLGVPEYVIEDDGPDHMKTFTAQVRVGDGLYGNGVGRSKKEAEQAAAETAYGEIAADLGVEDPAVDAAAHSASRKPLSGHRHQCPSCPRSRSSAPVWSGTSSARPSPGSTSCTRGPVRRDLRGPAGFASALTGRRIEAARRRGKYLWLPLDNGDALLAHLGMSGQLLVQPPGAPAERHLRVRFASSADCRPARCRFVDQRMFGGLSVSDGGADLPPEIAHIARDPLDPEFDDDEFVRRVRRRSSGIKRQLLDQNLVSGVGNIYADEALWRAELHGERPGDRLTATQVRELLGHAREVMTDGAGGGRHVVRRALRQRQRRVRLLRPLAARLRAGGGAVRPVRYADAPGRLHEPLVVLLPGLPARAAEAPGAGERDPRELGSRARRLTVGAHGGTLEDGPPTRALPTRPGRSIHGQGADRIHEQRPADPRSTRSRERPAARARGRAGGARPASHRGERPAGRRARRAAILDLEAASMQEMQPA